MPRLYVDHCGGRGSLRAARWHLPKPFTPAQIRHAAHQAAERSALIQHVTNLESQVQEAMSEAELTTGSARMQSVIDIVIRAASSDAPVLLRGESGTGKSVLARALHACSEQEISAAAWNAPRAYSWPGNIRELRNAIERAVILWPGQIIDVAALARAHGRTGSNRAPARR